MFIYWWIGTQLEESGEYIVFEDPSFNRCYKEWFIKNHVALFSIYEDNIRELIRVHQN